MISLFSCVVQWWSIEAALSYDLKTILDLGYVSILPNNMKHFTSTNPVNTFLDLLAHTMQETKGLNVWWGASIVNVTILKDYRGILHL